MSKQGQIVFQLTLPPRLRHAGLPIEVRSSNRRLVGRFDGSKPVTVDEGSYFISMRLPSGDELTDWVEVAAGGTTTASLSAESTSADDGDGDDDVVDADKAAPDDGDAFGVEHFRGATLGAASSGDGDVDAAPDDDGVPMVSPRILRGPMRGPHERRHAAASIGSGAPGAEPEVALSLRAWSGTIGDYQPLDPSTLTVKRHRGEIRVTVPGSSGAQLLVQLITRYRPGVILVLPARPHGPATQVVISHGRGAPVIDAHLDNALADAMIRDTTEVQRTKRIGETMAMRGLLADKISDPLAAAAGAVALLAVDQAEQVHGWIANLAHMFTWLPDGAALAAESAARQGDHVHAVQFLLALETRGIPLFSDSLSYALDRLGRYERDRGEPLADRARLQSLRRRLQPFAEFRISGRPLTTFRALEPSTPGDQQFGHSPPEGALQI